MLKKIFIILLTILLTSCGYTPVYKNIDNQDIKLAILSIEGNQKLNKRLITELNKFTKENDENAFTIKIKTSFDKNTISKDAKGNATNFELVASADFVIIFNGNKKKLLLNENLKIKKREDSFEQEKYENTIITNFAKSFKQKLILEINNF